MTSTHIYLIRHGEAESNVKPIMGGMRGDTGLTARGVAQAERLRDRLRASGELAADVLIASTLPRARQTAEIIAPALGLPIVWDDNVQELNTGEADGMSVTEFEATFGVPDFESDPFRPLAPGGESWAQFMLRVGTSLHRIAHQHAGKTVAVVCHGGIIDGSFIYLFGLSPMGKMPVRFHTHNTSITHWEYRERAGETPHWRLIGYNDDAHLHGTVRAAPADWRDTASDWTAEERPSVPLPLEQNGG